MPHTNRIMTFEQKQAVLQRVKPDSTFHEPPARTPFLNRPVPWEERLGNLEQWRKNQGRDRKILPALATEAQTSSVCNSIMQRLRKLFPNESWTCHVVNENVYLRYNGERRKYQRSDRKDSNDDADSLFKHTG